MSKEVEILVEVCREDVVLPEYAHIGDAGMDIRSAVDIDIMPNETLAIPTGLKVVIPIGYELQIRPRSGLSLKTPLRVVNSPGTIDAGYRDEVGVIINNSSKEGDTVYSISEKGNKQGIYRIKKGDRIAQCVLNEVPIIKWRTVDDISKEGINRGGGFGSSGTK